METEKPLPDITAQSLVKAPFTTGTATRLRSSVRWWQVAIFITSILAGVFWTLSAWDQWQMLEQARQYGSLTPAQRFNAGILSQRSAFFNLIAEGSSAVTAFLLLAQQVFEEGITWSGRR